MRSTINSIHTLAFATAISMAITLTISGVAKAEPTADDLKHSKDRNVILLPVPGMANPMNTPANTPAPKPAAQVTQKVEATKVAPSNKVVPSNKVIPSKIIATQKKVEKTKVAGAAKAAPSVKAPLVPSTQVVTFSKSPIKNVANMGAPHMVSTPKSPSKPVQKEDNTIINVWLDKKGSTPQYRNGEKMQINVSAVQECNVMIFDFDGHGKLTQLYPNEYQQKTLLKAGETITFGGADSPFDYQVSLPKGQAKVKERIFVYAYPVTEKPLSIALNTEDGSPFRSGEMTLSSYRKLVAESRVFFDGSSGPAPSAGQAGERDVKIVPKNAISQTSQLKLVSNEEAPSSQPNKKEISFTIMEH
ncbi:MAG: DUF4384 domain-containing protein [Leptolyngbya sp.]|nr:DUF4384 domain-containing protein [Candidatus Melainabacteria bacterium]